MIDQRTGNIIIGKVAQALKRAAEAAEGQPVSFTACFTAVSRDWGMLSISEFYEKYKEILQ